MLITDKKGEIEAKNEKKIFNNLKIFLKPAAKHVLQKL